MVQKVSRSRRRRNQEARVSNREMQRKAIADDRWFSFKLQTDFDFCLRVKATQDKAMQRLLAKAEREICMTYYEGQPITTCPAWWF